ncbi:MAG: hypothetical protein FWE82_08165 [Defluviitaleaceae bacterium]|nr:hypothetical protein [Defluviitaleaceae bacterium]
MSTVILWIIFAVSAAYYGAVGYLSSQMQVEGAYQVTDFQFMLMFVSMITGVVSFVIAFIKTIIYARKKRAESDRPRKEFKILKGTLRTIAVITEIGAVVLFIVGVSINTNFFEYGASQFAPMIPLVIAIAVIFFMIAFKPKSSFTFVAMLVFLYGSFFVAYGSFMDFTDIHVNEFYHASGPLILMFAALANAFASFVAYVCAAPSESKILSSGMWWGLFGICFIMSLMGVYEFTTFFVIMTIATFVIAVFVTIMTRPPAPSNTFMPVSEGGCIICGQLNCSHADFEKRAWAEGIRMEQADWDGQPISRGGSSQLSFSSDSGDSGGGGGGSIFRDVFGNQSGRMDGNIIRDQYGNQTGRIDGSIIRDQYGNHTGTFENGKLRDQNGNYVGELRDGHFYDANGNRTGSVGS